MKPQDLEKRNQLRVTVETAQAELEEFDSRERNTPDGLETLNISERIEHLWDGLVPQITDKTIPTDEGAFRGAIPAREIAMPESGLRYELSFVVNQDPYGDKYIYATWSPLDEGESMRRHEESTSTEDHRWREDSAKAANALIDMEESFIAYLRATNE
jgi:hypothetical protein